MLGTRDMAGLPAQRALLQQDVPGAEGITALQRYGVIEDMQDTHIQFSIPDLKIDSTELFSCSNTTARHKDHDIAVSSYQC
jgi:hypothetical protein